MAHQYDTKPRLLMVRPWVRSFEFRPAHDFFSAPLRAPTSLMQLAAWLKLKGFEVAIFDFERQLQRDNGDLCITLELFGSFIREYSPDIIGFSFYTAHITAVQIALEKAQRTCELYGLTPLFLAGGVHPTVAPAQVVEQMNFTCACLGEGEIPLLRLLAGSSYDNTPGIASSANLSPSSSDIVQNLDEIPFPDWNITDMPYYTQPNTLISQLNPVGFVELRLGRGCTYSCGFCAASRFLAHRYHSADYVIASMHHAAKMLKVKNFLLLDSSVGNNLALLAELCEKLIILETPYGWWANLRTNQADLNLLKMMRRAGCQKVFYGFESGSQKMLMTMNKQSTVEENYKVAHIHEKLHFPYHASFLLNYPGETVADLRETENMIQRIAPSGITLSLFAPVPGSLVFDQMLFQRLIHLNNLEDWEAVGSIRFSRQYNDIPPALFFNLYNQMKATAQARIVNH